jgi:hypothetical protein
MHAVNYQRLRRVRGVPLAPAPTPGQHGVAAQRRTIAIPRAGIWAGAVFALVAAAALYTRFSLQDTLSRDEAIYAYAGQQFAHGVPIYSSIFDPKTPGAAFLAGFGAVGARVLGTNDLSTIRLVFFVFACLTVVGVYFLTTQFWASPLAGVVSAVVFASFSAFAAAALGGPDAKTPGICFAVASMALLARRRWFWGALAGSLAFLVWQPLGVYMVLAVAFAAVAEGAPGRGSRVRHALAGAAVPLAVVSLYFLVAGSFGRFVDAAIVFPLVGVKREPETLGERFALIGRTINGSYGLIGDFLVFGGLLLLCGLFVARVVRRRPVLATCLRDPFCSVVMASFVALAIYSLIDFQGYPDVFPLLPYAAIGFGGAWFVVTSRLDGERLRRAAAAVALAAVAGLCVFSWHNYTQEATRQRTLPMQRARTADLERILTRDEKLYAFEDPRPLVLTHRRNPSRYIFLTSGVAPWLVKHTHGGLAGWEAKIAASRPAALVMPVTWGGVYPTAIGAWLLRRGYRRVQLHGWRVFLKPAILRRAVARGVVLRVHP